MSDREQRGLALVALYKIGQRGGKWIVRSQTGNATRYEVDPNPEHPHCTCSDHKDRGVKCKHICCLIHSMYELGIETKRGLSCR